jgi:hypothetical protein
MSIYAESSQAYWKERQKKPNEKSPVCIAGVVHLVLFALAGSVLYARNSPGPTVKSLNDQVS